MFFIFPQDDVAEFIKTNRVTVESSIGAFNELYSKYKYMENSFIRSKNVYKSKIPEIEQTLELVKVMNNAKESENEVFANYSLCDTIYAKAKVRGREHNKKNVRSKES